MGEAVEHSQLCFELLARAANGPKFNIEFYLALNEALQLTSHSVSFGLFGLLPVEYERNGAAAPAALLIA